MEYQKYFKYFLLLALSSVLIYLTITNQYTNILQSLRLPVTHTNLTNETISFNVSIINQTDNLEEFQSRISDFYPRLSIHIYTQNLSLITNKSKLILLGNGFFGDRDWGIPSFDSTSRKKMTELYCPFLSDRCDITTDYERFKEADAVVYHMRDSVDKKQADEKRHSKQRFVFALWESPVHTPSLSEYNRFFNWTMTYRFKSDIITTYYFGNSYVHSSSSFYQTMLKLNLTNEMKLKLIKQDDRPSDEILNKKKLGTAAALISNCGGNSRRLTFIRKLSEFIDVKVYGRCGTACPSNINCRQFIAENYYFILSFENSLCTDYTTEKFFASLEYPIVPVVFGRTNYSYFIPSSGFINTNRFSKMRSLAQFLNETRYDKEKYLSYFSWKKDYVWGLNHFMTPFCDLCLRLHLDSKPSIIDDMGKWWFDDACREADIPQ